MRVCPRPFVDCMIDQSGHGASNRSGAHFNGHLVYDIGVLMGIIYQGCGALSATLLAYIAAAFTLSRKDLGHRSMVKGYCCPLPVFQQWPWAMSHA